jgi:hypothetical protein
MITPGPLWRGLGRTGGRITASGRVPDWGEDSIIKIAGVPEPVGGMKRRRGAGVLPGHGLGGGRRRLGDANNFGVGRASVVLGPGGSANAFFMVPEPVLHISVIDHYWTYTHIV